MLLSMVLSQARNGELKQLSSKDKTDEVVIDFINMAMIALYSRFVLKTQEAVIALRSTKTIYNLDGSDADVTVAGATIEGGTVMVITEAYEENGVSIGVNDSSNVYSIFTPSYNQVQVPMVEDNSYISIIYKTNPVVVSFTDDGSGNAVDTNVDLPIQLLEPLLHYIGYRAHGSVDGSISTENNTHLQRFRASCNDIEKLGTLMQEDMNGLTVRDKGYV